MFWLFVTKESLNFESRSVYLNNKQKHVNNILKYPILKMKNK